MQGTMKHTLALVLMVFGIVGCSMPQEEKENIAAVTCSIMSETRNMDAAIRVEKMNDARDKIDGEPFLRGDAAIKEAFDWGLCQELVLNETYDERLKSLKDAEREIERIAAEKRAEEQRIADSKPIIEKEYFPNGNIKRIVRYQAKNAGGRKEGLTEEFTEDGKLLSTINFLNGKLNGEFIRHYKNGQVKERVSYKLNQIDGLWVEFDESGKQTSKACWKDSSTIDISYCEK
jgi:hypothetical protein